MTLSHPGVWIDELPSGAHVIAGVATSVTLFIGCAARGAVSAPARLRSFADYERQHGGLDASSFLAYGVKQFFDNGGSEALTLRITAADARSAVAKIGGITVSATSPGEWAHAYRVRLMRHVDDAKRFRLEVLHQPGNVVERFDDLSMAPRNPRFVERVVNGQSAILVAAAAGTRVPANAIADLGARVRGADGARIGPGDAAFHAEVAALFGASSITDRIDLFNLVCVPGLTDTATIARLQADCRRRRAFLIVDSPQAASVASMPAVRSGLAGPDAMNSALYFPWLRSADPLAQGAAREFPPSGFVAGVYARVDATRGVWKAPAGSGADVHGALGLATPMNDAEARRLGPLGIDCLRTFPSQGILVWGARTLQGSDGEDPSWKYVAVRRLGLYIEESLARSVRWAAFESNGQALWATLRSSIDAFMNGLWRAGALMGQTPSQAYFVKCDSTTTTAADIGRGVVHIQVGFAPIKPAEFVVIALQQRTAAAT